MLNAVSNREGTNVFVRFFSYIINKLWLLLAFGIILVAVLHIFLGFFLPQIDRYAPEITNWIEEKYQVKVEASSISAEWSIHGPVLELKDLKINSSVPSDDSFEVGRISIYFDIITSLWNQRFSTEEIIIDEAKIDFYLNDSLGVKLKLNSESTNSKTVSDELDFESLSSQVFDILFGQRKLHLSDVDIRLITAKGQYFPYNLESVEIKRFDDIHQLTGSLKGESGENIALVAEVFGDPSQPSSNTQIYMQGKDLNVESIPWYERERPFIPNAGTINWKLWGEWDSGVWKDVSASIELDGIDWESQKPTNANESRSPTQVASTNKITSMFSWQQNDTSLGLFVIHDAYILIEDEVSLPLADIHGKYAMDSVDSASWSFVAENFQLEPLFKYLGKVTSTENNLTNFLRNANPSMFLNNLQLTIPKRLALWQEPELQLSFSELSYQQWNQLPRASELAGELYLQQSGGIVSVYANDAKLELDKLFRHSIDINSINALLTWSRFGEEPLEFQLRDFNLQNNDLAVHAEAEVFYQDSQPIFSLYTELTGVNAGNKSLYLPVDIMEPDLVKYLDNSVRSGRFSIIKNVVRGNMNMFPFPNTDGYFAALGFLENSEYKYLPDWPSAKELDAKLLFVGNGMDITATNSKSYGNHVNYARALTKDFSVAYPKMELNIEVNSSNNSAQEFLSKTPLLTVSEALSNLEIKGNTKTELKLNIGLNEGDESPLKLQGKVDFAADFEKLTTQAIDIDSVQGTINFNQDSIIESTLAGSHQGNELSISLGGAANPNRSPLWIAVKGELQSELIGQFIGDDASRFIAGKAFLETLITFPSRNAKSNNVEIEIDSTMEGLSVLLPGELGKNAEQLSPLHLNLSLGEYSSGELNWSGIEGKWYWKKNHITNESQVDIAALENSSIENQIDYGVYLKIDKVNKAKETKDRDWPFVDDVIPAGINIDANFNHLNLEEWITFVSTLNSQSNAKSASSSTQNLQLTELQKRFRVRPILVNNIALSATNMDSRITDFTDSKIVLSKALDRPWEIDFSSPETELYMILHSEAPWNINIEKMDIHLLKQKDNPELAEENTLSPEKLFDIDVDCKRCQINGVDYGSIKSKIRKGDSELIFDGVVSNNKKHQIVFAGVWNEPSNEGSDQDSTSNTDEEKIIGSTRIEIDLTTDDAGSLLKRWDIEAAIKDSPGRLIASSNWDGAPWDFDYLNANADLELKLDKGYLSEISDGQGRLFSLFNLQSLIRKLTFDFKDVYKKGFFFDSIVGTFSLASGEIATENVSIKGNVADVKLYGKTNLVNESIDQIAVITPHLTSSLPVLAAWAVEPTTGILVWMINKIMEPAVEVATRIDYRIQGTFDEVDVTQVNSSRKKIKVEYETKLDETTDQSKPENESKNEGSLELESESSQNLNSNGQHSTSE